MRLAIFVPHDGMHATQCIDEVLFGNAEWKGVEQ